MIFPIFFDYFRFIKRKILDLLAGIAFFFLQRVLKIYYLKDLDFLKRTMVKSKVHPTLLKNPQILFKTEGVSVLSNLPQKSNPEFENKKNIAVYTCITNGYDEVSSPVFHQLNCDCILFTDNPNLKAPGWKTIFLENPLGLDPKRLSRLPKILPHRFLKDYEYSIYIDGNMEILGNITLLFSFLDSETIAAFKHPERNCLYKEAEIVIAGKYDTEETVRKQIKKYKGEDFPENYGLFACGLMVRKHFDQKLMETMELWWRELNAHSTRDQLSFTYSLWKTSQNIVSIEGCPYNNEFFRTVGHTKRYFSS